MDYSKDSIVAYLRTTMEELFEIDPAAVRPEARLYEDLDIDSIDAVDLIVKLKEFTGKKIAPAAFRDVRTVQDIVDAVYDLLNKN